MSQTKEKTKKELEMALYRITKGRAKVVNKKRKLSILAVAEEAGVSTATIHNRHPEIAEKIRVLLNNNSRAQRDAKHTELKVEKTKNVELRRKIDELNEQLAKIASINARLEIDNMESQRILHSDNVSVFKKRD